MRDPELIILGPGVHEFGEDAAIDSLIRQYGYIHRYLVSLLPPTIVRQLAGCTRAAMSPPQIAILCRGDTKNILHRVLTVRVGGHNTHDLRILAENAVKPRLESPALAQIHRVAKHPDVVCAQRIEDELRRGAGTVVKDKDDAQPRAAQSSDEVSKSRLRLPCGNQDGNRVERGRNGR